MSILQEYQGHARLIGKRKYEALFDYIVKHDVSYSDVIYNRRNWEEFDKWYKEVYNSGHGRSSKRNKKI